MAFQLRRQDEIGLWTTQPNSDLIQALTKLSHHLKVQQLVPYRASNAWYRWDTIRDDVKREAGLDLSDVVLHTFRHTCLTRLAKRLPIHKVSQWAGHASIQITVKHYAHLQADDLMGALDVLNA